jgi:hypothetical protein
VIRVAILLFVAAVATAEPLPYGRDLIEVRPDQTLGRRYRHWGDWNKEVASYLEEARENAKTRGTPARRLTMGCVFLKDARMTSTDVKGGDGQPLTATYSTPEKFVEAMKQRGMREYSDYMFAFSGGEVEVRWITVTVEGLHWRGPGTGWGCQPRAVSNQVIKALEPYKNDGVCMWMFCAGRPTTLNPDPKQPKLKFGAPPYGVSYTQWPLHGGYSLVTSAPDLGVMVHEFNHRYLDNLQTLEGVHLTQFHGLANLGYDGKDCGFPELMNTYSSVYRYIVRRDMWRRFTITTPNQTPREPFSGKAYAWAAVKDDCWFKLPELHDAELAKLTGLPSFHVDAPKRSALRLFTVNENDRARVRSPYVAAAADKDVRLNNLASLHTESCAVVATDTGHWLFVRPDLADVYVEMCKQGAPLPVYGYVNEGICPLVVLKAPTNFAVPANEAGYLQGLVSRNK